MLDGLSKDHNNVNAGWIIGSVLINYFIYADDSVLVAPSSKLCYYQYVYNMIVMNMADHVVLGTTVLKVKLWFFFVKCSKIFT